MRRPGTWFRAFALTGARSALTASAMRYASAAATATATVVVCAGTAGTTLRTASCGLAGNGGRSFNAVEVRLILLVELLAALLFEVVSALDENRALI